MDKIKLMDLIYDKLVDNDEREQFEWSMAEDMCVAIEDKTHEPKLAIVIDGVEYVLSIKANGKNEREFYD